MSRTPFHLWVHIPHVRDLAQDFRLKFVNFFFAKFTKATTGTVRLVAAEDLNCKRHFKILQLVSWSAAVYKTAHSILVSLSSSCEPFANRDCSVSHCSFLSSIYTLAGERKERCWAEFKAMNSFVGLDALQVSSFCLGPITNWAQPWCRMCEG